MLHTFQPPVRRTTLAAIAFLLLQGGCADGEPTPRMPEESSPSSPASETATAPVEPTLPPEAEGKGIKAAEAFIRHYFAVVDHARVTGDTQQLRTIALDTCRSCAGVVHVIERVRRNDGAIDGGVQTVVRIRLGRLTGVREVVTYRGEAQIKSTRQVIEGSGDSSLDGSYPAGRLRLGVLVVKGLEGWRFAEWSVLS